MKKQTDYTIVEAYRAGMMDDLIYKVKKLQKKGWVCQGSIVLGNPGGESSCYHAMVKEEKD